MHYEQASRKRKNSFMAACQDPESPAFTRAGAMLALRRFLSDASFDEARRNLDSNQSVIRVAAVSKLEDLPPEQSHASLGAHASRSHCIGANGSGPHSFARAPHTYLTRAI